MKKINLLKLIDGSWYIDLDLKILHGLIIKSKDKLGSQLSIAKYLKIEPSTINRWLGKVKSKNTKPSYNNIKKLIKLNSLSIKETNKNIRGIKSGREHRFLNINCLDLNKKLVRSLAFIIGDGSIEKRRIRFSNSDKLVIKTILNDFIDSFNITKKPKITLTVPRHFSNKKTLNTIKDWEYYINKKIDKTKKKHLTNIKGKPFKSLKEYIEVSFTSPSLSKIVQKIIPIIKLESLKNNSLSISYLQGIYAAEGSVYHRKKNAMRAIQINMKNKDEIDYIVKLLNFINIKNSGLKHFNKQKTWYIYISGKKNIKKCEQISLFYINEKRKNKLKEIANNYQRRQSTHFKKKNRYTQIIEILHKYETINSYNLSKKLDISLIRTQVLLQRGFNENEWNRFWNGKELVYFKNG